MNWRFDRLRGFPLDAVLIAAACIVLIFSFRLGFNLADEGSFVWNHAYCPWGKCQCGTSSPTIRGDTTGEPSGSKSSAMAASFRFEFNYAASSSSEWFSALDSAPANMKSWWAGGGRSGDLDVDGSL